VTSPVTSLVDFATLVGSNRSYCHKKQSVEGGCKCHFYNTLFTKLTPSQLDQLAEFDNGRFQQEYGMCSMLMEEREIEYGKEYRCSLVGSRRSSNGEPYLIVLETYMCSSYSLVLSKKQ
jgi:hypothetical protein